MPINEPLDGRKNVKLEPRAFDELPEEVQDLLQERRSSKSRDRSTVGMLEGKYILSMILYIDKMSPVMKSDLYNDISRGAGMADKVEDLRKLGLIEVYRTARTTANVLVITDKGRRVANLVRDMLSVVEDD